MKELTGQELKIKIDYIRLRMQMGNLTYDQAKVEAAPILAEMNARGKVIAKKHNRRYPPITFAGIMR